MKIQTLGEGMELILRSLPYPEQVKDIDLSKKDAIYFRWRSSNYKLDLIFCRVDMVEGSILNGNDASILMTELFKQNLIKR